MSDRFKYESLQDTETLVAYLDNLRQGFASGELSLVHGNKELLLKPKGLITFEVEAKASGEERKLSMKFRWKERQPGKDSGKDPLVMRTPKAE